jgi:hypothetical protein
MEQSNEMKPGQEVMSVETWYREVNKLSDIKLEKIHNFLFGEGGKC